MAARFCFWPGRFFFMDAIDRQLEWIDTQHDRMVRLVTEWAGINSGSENLDGLARMMEALEASFAGLGGEQRRIELPPRRYVDAVGNAVDAPLGESLSVVRRPEAPRRVFLCIHMDTVYGPEHPFQAVETVDEKTLRGPGVTDAKGGLVVMLVALEALERSGLADQLGWEVLINSDEEIGSPGSSGLFYEASERNGLGLVFEPSLPDGQLIAERKGSGNFAVVIRGRSAHAGREFELGRNGLTAAARLGLDLEALRDPANGLTVNIARLEGGGPLNVVPELGICRFNVRYRDAEQQDMLRSRIDERVAGINDAEGYSAELHGGFTAPPKALDGPTEQLLESIAACGRGLGLDIRWRSSGGVCDGNRLAAAGLPAVDTLGVRGGAIHSAEEDLLTDSLTERAKLTALLLMNLAVGRTPWPG
jgi:glutamate carboxypeptidase